MTHCFRNRAQGDGRALRQQTCPISSNKKAKGDAPWRKQPSATCPDKIPALNAAHQFPLRIGLNVLPAECPTFGAAGLAITALRRSRSSTSPAGKKNRSPPERAFLRKRLVANSDL